MAGGRRTSGASTGTASRAMATGGSPNATDTTRRLPGVCGSERAAAQQAQSAQVQGDSFGAGASLR